MKHLKQVSYILFSWLLLLATSCVDEGDNYCPPPTSEIRVYFSPPALTEDALRTATPIELIDLYVFNERGQFVKSQVEEISELRSDYHMKVDLKPGNYTFVSWANLKDCYGLSHEEISEDISIDELLLHLRTEENDTISTRIHTLYFGNLTEEEIRKGENHTFTIPLVRNTYNLSVTTRAFTPNPDHTYEIVVSDRNGSYTFDNSFGSPKEVHYKSSCITNEGNQLHGSVSSLRLNEKERYAHLKLRDVTVGETVYERNLVELVEKYREMGMEIDFDTMFDFEVMLGFDTDTQVTVTINGWELIEDLEELK